MEYNTAKKDLILPEYGRNVQMMAEHLLTIQDRDRRNDAAKELVSIMINMNPAVKETKDFKQKIWDFLAQLCGYKLDVDFPYPVTKVQELKAPERLQYNMNDIRLRHYGYTVERMIDAAVKLEDGEEKQALTVMIANNMKRNFVVWNQKSVTDEIIISDLMRLSHGQLSLPVEARLQNISNQCANQQGNQKKGNFKRQNNQGKKNKNNKKAQN